MKSTGKTIFVIVAVVVVLVAVLVFYVSKTSKKLVCKSKEGNITIMYDSKKIKGYTAKNIKYDLDGQKKVAEQIGIDKYLDEFEKWFSTNTTGTCERK